MGACRWALNNVATYGTPSCIPTLAQLQSDPTFMSRMANASRSGNASSVDMVQSGSDDRVRHLHILGLDFLFDMQASALHSRIANGAVILTLH